MVIKAKPLWLFISLGFTNGRIIVINEQSYVQPRQCSALGWVNS
jgi:hypothetical protein